MITHITAGFPAVFFDEGDFTKQPRRNKKRNDPLERVSSGPVTSSSAEGTTDKTIKTAEKSADKENATPVMLLSEQKPTEPPSATPSADSGEIKQTSVEHPGDDSSSPATISDESVDVSSEKNSITQKLEALATAYTVTPGNIGYFPSLIRGRGIEDAHAKEAAVRMMKDAPIVKNAIVFEQGKKPRIIKAIPNIIVL